MTKLTTTVTTKGQVVIPKQIRSALDIRVGQMLQFMLEDGYMIVKPVMTTREAQGFIKTNRRATDADYKKAITKAVKQKHDRI